MVTKEEINKINELARKAKTPEGLTKDELKEQQDLRAKYVAAYRENLRAQLDRIKIVDKENQKDKNIKS